jgi:hypothetical protein
MIHDITDINQINTRLLKTVTHLIDASKYLSDIPEFQEESYKIALLAKCFIDVVEPQKEKITEETINSILDEILNAQ